jgi:hypothetical protein
MTSFRTWNSAEQGVDLESDELAICINFMPVGNALYAVPAYSSALATIGAGETSRANLTPYVVNQIVSPATPNGFIYLCTVGGTSAAAPPTWPVINGNSVTDGGVTWRAYDCTIQRFFYANFNNVFYWIVFTLGGMVYRIDSSWNVSRISMPALLTNPMVDQWSFTTVVGVDPLNGYFYINNNNSPVMSANIAQATTLTKVKLANFIEYVIGNNHYTKSATDNFWDLTGFNCTQGNYNQCYLYINAAGAASMVTGTQAVTLAGVVLPAIDTARSLVGILTVNPSGGNFIGGTTSLTDGVVLPSVVYANQTSVMMVPNIATGTAICVWKLRVWIATGTRAIMFSAPSSFTDWTVLDGAGAVQDYYSDLTTTINNMVGTQDYLYVCGDHSTHIIFGLQMLSTGTTTFQIADTLPEIGAFYPETVIPYAQFVYMMGDYGIHAAQASSYKLLSHYLDGFYPTISTGFTPMAFLARVYNKLLYCILCLAPSPVDGTNHKYLVCYYENRWFQVDYGLANLNYCAAQENSSSTNVFGAVGNTIVQLFYANSSAVLTRQCRTKDYNFGLPVNDKQSLKVGAELYNITGLNAPINVVMTVIGNVSSDNVSIQFSGSSILFTNASGNPVVLTNASAQVIYISALVNDMLGYKSVSARGKTLIVDFMETGSQLYQIQSFFLQAQKGAEW